MTHCRLAVVAFDPHGNIFIIVNSSDIKESSNTQFVPKQHQNGFSKHPECIKFRVFIDDADDIHLSQTKAINDHSILPTDADRVRRCGSIGFTLSNDNRNDPSQQVVTVDNILIHPQESQEIHKFPFPQIYSDSSWASGHFACNSNQTIPVEHGEHFKHHLDKLARYSTAANSKGHLQLDNIDKCDGDFWDGLWNGKSLASMGSEYFDEKYCLGSLDQGVGPVDNMGSDNFIKGVSSQFLRVMDVGPIDDMGSDNFNKRALSQSWIFYYGKKPGFSSFAGSMETRQC